MNEFLKRLDALKSYIVNISYRIKPELRYLVYGFKSVLYDYDRQSRNDNNSTMELHKEASKIATMIEKIGNNVRSSNEIDYCKRACSKLRTVIDALISKILIFQN